MDQETDWGEARQDLLKDPCEMRGRGESRMTPGLLASAAG